MEATDIASNLFRPDKVSKSLIAHFWGSKLLMITVRLSARRSAPAEPLPVVKVTNPRGRWGKEVADTLTGSSQHYGLHEASMTRKQQIKPRVEDTSTVMLNVLGLKCEQAK